LAKRGLVKTFLKEIERKHFSLYSEEHIELKPTAGQQSVIDEVTPVLTTGEFKTYLLHGVTGSGKTQVYIELVKKTLALGKTAIILVPEISLTPQITTRLFNNFGETVALIHSKMSPGERFDSWQKTLKGKAKVVVGARSALFSPMRNVGLIVVDEEHDSSYKQDESPKYQGRDAAVVKAKFSDCPVILGSATPSVESMFNVYLKKFYLLKLPERIDDAKLPRITLVNVIEEKKRKRMENIFSQTLLEKIDDRLKKKEGVIILQNRRGFATQLYCVDCGELETCSNCSVSMVYHINQNLLQCHYCGFTRKVPEACSNCGSKQLKYFGTGTERVEDELAYYFPNVNISRVDSDSISKKGTLGEILAKFKSGETDILVGTQMVAKGLDFSRVTLVGVVSAETSLWLPDFRADERTFQLLTQVSGRAGRSKVEGEVLIQTQNHKHFALQKVLENDYEGFYKKEIADRERMGYPPFTRLCLIEMKDKDHSKVKRGITDFYNELLIYKQYVKVFPPSTAIIARLKGEYRYQILVKSNRSNDPGGAVLRTAITSAEAEFKKKSSIRDIPVSIDIDPQSII
jgi:primosomal protein N' (replication factor Y)